MSETEMLNATSVEIIDKAKKSAGLVAEELNKIEPNLQRVAFSKKENIDRVINSGQYDIQLDLGAIRQMLTICGLKVDEMSDLSIVFRNAGIADKDASGSVIGGLFDGGVEIYTSYFAEDLMPAVDGSVERGILRNRLVLLAINRDALASRLAHELRHYIQLKKSMFEDRATWFAKDMAQHDSDPAEVDAIEFQKIVGPVLSRFVNIGLITELPDIYDKNQSAKDYHLLSFGEEMVDKNLPAVVMTDTEPPGVVVLNKIDKFMSGDMADEMDLHTILGILDQLVLDKQIGFMERRYLVGKIWVKASIFGPPKVNKILSDRIEKYRAAFL